MRFLGGFAIPTRARYAEATGVTVVADQRSGGGPTMSFRRRSHVLALALAVLSLGGVLPAAGPIGVSAQATPAAGWDMAKAHEECKDFTTYGMAEEGVYGPWFQAMYAHYGWTDCKRTDND